MSAPRRRCAPRGPPRCSTAPMKSKGDQRELNQREPHIEMIARADREPLKADHNGSRRTSRAPFRGFRSREPLFFLLSSLLCALRSLAILTSSLVTLHHPHSFYATRSLTSFSYASTRRLRVARFGRPGCWIPDRSLRWLRSVSCTSCRSCSVWSIWPVVGDTLTRLGRSFARRDSARFRFLSLSAGRLQAGGLLVMRHKLAGDTAGAIHRLHLATSPPTVG